MTNDEIHSHPLPGLGLFFGIIEQNKRPQILWSGSTWHSELSSWQLLLSILSMKDKTDLENVDWSFLPLVFDEVEIFAITKLFRFETSGLAYLVIFHESAEILTQFLLQFEARIGMKFSEILTSSHATFSNRLTNEQLKQLRINCQKFYEILSEL
ncbi:MAG: hypothetical protein ACFFFG_00820 [Candidatus Thorarchaeota archaeon]